MDDTEPPAAGFHSFTDLLGYSPEVRASILKARALVQASRRIEAITRSGWG